jgi:mono/diheme cytochrome c family protein
MQAAITGGFVLCVLLPIGVLFSEQKSESPQGKERIQGASLFQAHCAVCHGRDAKGGGPMAQSLKVSPPDLTRIAVRNGAHFPLARVQKIIAGEVPIPAGHGTREMPVWGPVFSQIVWDQDLGQIRVYNLAKFIEQMQVK